MSPCNYVHVLHNGRTIGEVICTCKEGYARVSRRTSLSNSLSPKPELAIAEYNRFFDVLCFNEKINSIMQKIKILLGYPLPQKICKQLKGRCKENRRFVHTSDNGSSSAVNGQFTVLCCNFKTICGVQESSRNMIVVSDRQTTQAGESNSLESILGLLKN